MARFLYVQYVHSPVKFFSTPGEGIKPKQDSGAL